MQIDRKKIFLRAMIFIFPLPLFSGIGIFFGEVVSLIFCISTILLFYVIFRDSFHFIDRITLLALVITLVMSALSGIGSVSNDVVILFVLLYSPLALRPFFDLR